MSKANGTKNRKVTGRSRLLLPVILLASALVFSAVGGVLAKYITRSAGQDVAMAHEFYFTSDLLTREGERHSLSSGTDSITVKICNFEDNLRYSTLDIDFTVTVTDGESGKTVAGRLTGNSKNQAVIEIGSGKTLDMDVESGKVYTVTAKGENGFSETLTAVFTVLPEEGTVYKYAEDEEYYVTLTVWTQNISGNVQIAYPGNELVADSTDKVMKNVSQSASGFTDTLNFDGAYSSYKYRFFKKDTTKKYTAENFTVSCAGVTATVKAPER